MPFIRLNNLTWFARLLKTVMIAHLWFHDVQFELIGVHFNNIILFIRPGKVDLLFHISTLFMPKLSSCTFQTKTHPARPVLNSRFCEFLRV